MTLWLKEFLGKKNKDFKYSYWVILIGLFLLTFVPLKFTNILGHKYNKIFGMDRLLFSSITGAILVQLSTIINS
jgi:hypothetical protein